VSEQSVPPGEKPQVVLGLPIYGSESFIGDALESLLALDYENFAIVAIDDCSPDSTLEIARSYAASDPRLVVEANVERLGMIGNWNRVLARTYELYPAFDYFAWASDNDVRETRWISSLVEALESDPRAALAYSRFGTLAEGEKVVPDGPKWLFETTEIADPLQRLDAATKGMRAGPTMYGLHRRRTLDRIGDVPPVLLSDFVFLSCLSLYGTFLQVPEVLWFRDLRQVTGGSMRRQRAALFSDPPARTYLPVSLQHTLWLFDKLVVRGEQPSGMGRLTALRVPLFYQFDWCRRLAIRSRKLFRRRIGKLLRIARKFTLTRRLLATPIGKRMARRLVGQRSMKG
jgi:glycosyltransferase involved in cell wall biosynthesis